MRPRVHTFLGIEVVQYLSIHVARIVFAASILETIVIEKKRKGKEKREINWKKLKKWKRERKNENSTRGIDKKNIRHREKERVI